MNKRISYQQKDYLNKEIVEAQSKQADVLLLLQKLKPMIDNSSSIYSINDMIKYCEFIGVYLDFLNRRFKPVEQDEQH